MSSQGAGSSIACLVASGSLLQAALLASSPSLATPTRLAWSWGWREEPPLLINLLIQGVFPEHLSRAWGPHEGDATMMGSTAGLSPSYPGRARNPTCSSMGPLSVESPGGRGEGWRLRVQQAATRTPGSHPWIHEPQCPFQRDFDSGNPSSRTLSALIRTHQTERQGAGEVQSVLVPALVSPSPQAWAAPSKGHRDHPGVGGQGQGHRQIWASGMSLNFLLCDHI